MSLVLYLSNFIFDTAGQTGLTNFVEVIMMQDESQERTLAEPKGRRPKADMGNWMPKLNTLVPGWTPVPQIVARRLQKMILDGQLKTGDVIPSQRQLSEQFNVSRTSLREALLTLETLGLVKTEPGRGTFVTPNRSGRGAALKWRYSDSHSMQDVFETRQMLEGQIALLTALSIDAQTIAILTAATNEMEQFWEKGDLLANVEADLRFHRTIALSCPNLLLQSVYETVQDLLAETQRQPIPGTNPTRMRASLAEHRDIIAALALADGHAACLAMRRHVANTATCAGIAIGVGPLPIIVDGVEASL